MRTSWVRASGAAGAALLIAVTIPALAGPTIVSLAAATAAARPAVAPYLAPTSGTLAWRSRAAARIGIGRSVQGRPIVAVRRGSATAPHVVLVIGQMHGSEPRGRDVVRDLLAQPVPVGLQVWTISTLNPDGAARGTRRNAHQVDLNRNFPDGWSPRYTNLVYYPGPRAASEPETRAAMAFLDRLRPELVVSLHQAFNSVDVGNPKTRLWSGRLAAAFGLRTTAVPCRGPCAGTMTGFYNRRYAGYAVTVELPATVSAARAITYARATLRVARLLAPPPSPSPLPPDPSPPTPVPFPPAPATSASATPRPPGVVARTSATLNTPSPAGTTRGSLHP
jgi:hypothetical protein